MSASLATMSSARASVAGLALSARGRRTGAPRGEIRMFKLAAMAGERQPASDAMATVKVQKSVPFGRSLKVVGSHPLMGDWDPSNGADLEWSEGDVWTASLALPPGAWEFKVVVIGGGQPDEWEGGDNRVVEVEAVLVEEVAEDAPEAEEAEMVVAISEMVEEPAEEPLMEPVRKISEPAMASVMASAVTAEPPASEMMAVKVEEQRQQEQEEEETEAAAQQAPPASNVVPLPMNMTEQARSQPISNALEARDWIDAWRERSASAPATAISSRAFSAAAEEKSLPKEQEASDAPSGESARVPVWPLAGALSVATAMAAAFVFVNGIPEGIKVPAEVSKIMPSQAFNPSSVSKPKLTVASKPATMTELLLQNYSTLNADKP